MRKEIINCDCCGKEIPWKEYPPRVEVVYVVKNKAYKKNFNDLCDSCFENLRMGINKTIEECKKKNEVPAGQEINNTTI